MLTELCAETSLSDFSGTAGTCTRASIAIISGSVAEDSTHQPQGLLWLMDEHGVDDDDESFSVTDVSSTRV